MTNKKSAFSATSAIPETAITSNYKPLITFNRQQERETGYKDEHHLIQEKIVPKSIQLLAAELALPHNRKISEESRKGQTFEQCLAILAARLDIALDGSYDAASLCDVLLTALQNRKLGPIQSHHLRDPRLVNAEIVETAGALTLEEIGDKHEIKLKEAPSGEGPYTICRGCVTSFDCIQERSCKNGTPAQQLGNTIKTLKHLRRTIKK